MTISAVSWRLDQIKMNRRQWTKNSGFYSTDCSYWWGPVHFADISVSLNHIYCNKGVLDDISHILVKWNIKEQKQRKRWNSWERGRECRFLRYLNMWTQINGGSDQLVYVFFIFEEYPKKGSKAQQRTNCVAYADTLSNWYYYIFQVLNRKNICC